MECEHVTSGLLTQPMSTLSSLSCIAAAIALAVPVLRRKSPPRVDRVIFAAVLAADGVGSALYHGVGPARGHVVHDSALLSTLFFIGTHDLGAVRGWSERRTLATFAAGSAAIGPLVAVVPRLTDAAAAVLAAGCVVAEIAAHRAGLPPVPLTVALLAPGAILEFAGRAGGPLCQPESLLQGHAAWHALAAAALWAWGRQRLAPDRTLRRRSARIM